MNHGTDEVTGKLLELIGTWRERLGRNIALRNPATCGKDLDIIVHGIVSRILFLRLCEERGILEHGTLREILGGEMVCRRLLGLFPCSYGGKDTSPRGGFAPDLTIDEHILREITGQLYDTGSSWYSVVTPSILAEAYDRFLGKALRLGGGYRAWVEERPETKAGGGIPGVPRFAVDYVARSTLDELGKGKNPEEVSGLRILDPACGAGSFLIAACQFLFDWHRDWYAGNLVSVLTAEGSPHASGVRALIPAPPGGKTGWDGVTPELPIFRDPGDGDPGRAPEWRLTSAERGRIVGQVIHGVDIDPRAVEMTRLTLLLTVLWEVDRDLPGPEGRPVAAHVLRCLERNIRCGNTLVGPNYFWQKQAAPYNFDERMRINPFDWQSGFPGIMDAGGFDAIIGYLPTTLERPHKGVEEYFQTHFRSYHGGADLSGYFIEKGISLLRPGGIFSVVAANRWLRARSGTPLRRWLKEKQIEEIVDLGDLPEYRNAMTYPCLLRVRNAPVSHRILISRPDTSSFESLGEYIGEHHFPVDPGDLSDGGWTLTDSRTEVLLGKIRGAGTPLDSLIMPRDDKYLAGILGSRLAQFFGKAYGVRIPHGSSPPARVVPKNFPVYVPDFDDPADSARHDRMVALVTQMLDLHKRLHETTLEHEKTVIQRQIEATDREIDELVYQLYGLTEEERRIVEEGMGGEKQGA